MTAIGRHKPNAQYQDRARNNHVSTKTVKGMDPKIAKSLEDIMIAKMKEMNQTKTKAVKKTKTIDKEVYEKRKQDILNKIKTNGAVTTKELSDEMECITQIINKDLKILMNSGKVQRIKKKSDKQKPVWLYLLA